MGDGLRCPSLCSPVSDQCHDSQSTEHAPYYFDCQVCEHGNDGGAPCWPDYKYASPRSSTCHSDNSGDDGFYYIDCEPSQYQVLEASRANISQQSMSPTDMQVSETTYQIDVWPSLNATAANVPET